MTELEKSSLAYAIALVNRKNEYQQYSQDTQMNLTGFNAYDIQQAFEDGAEWYKNSLLHTDHETPDSVRPVMYFSKELGTYSFDQHKDWQWIYLDELF